MGINIYIWQQDIAAVKKQIVQLEENKKHVYTLVIGQCSPNPTESSMDLPCLCKPRLIKMSCSSS